MKQSLNPYTVRSLLYNNRQISVRCLSLSSAKHFYRKPASTAVPSSFTTRSSIRALSTTTNNLLPQNTPSSAPSKTQTTPAGMSLQIRAIESSDSETWISLWEQYNQFYKRTIPIEVTQTTLSRFLDPSMRMYCALAIDPETSKTIGFVTWYPHPTTSSIQEIVYLQDLFVDPSVRNKGTGRALIEHVYEHAKTIPVNSVYWNTQYFNYVGQILYNKVASRTDFIRYQKNF